MRWLYQIDKKLSVQLVRMYKSKSTPDNAFCLCYTLYLESIGRFSCKVQMGMKNDKQEFPVARIVL